MAIHNALQGSLSISGYTGTTILRTFSPDHFEDGQWHNGGKCVRTTPGDVPMRDLTKWMYDFQIQEFQNVTGLFLSAPDCKIDCQHNFHVSYLGIKEIDVFLLWLYYRCFEWCGKETIKAVGYYEPCSDTI